MLTYCISEQTGRRFPFAYLVLIELAVLVLLLALVLERDDDEADEDVDHEEGDDDDVDEVEDCDARPVVVDRARVLLVRIDAPIHQTVDTNSHTEKSLFAKSCKTIDNQKA